MVTPGTNSIVRHSYEAHAARGMVVLERLYNHVGDIGNICAGAGFHLGSSRGAILKERLQRLNEQLTGHRYLMGVVGVGGMRDDLAPAALADAGGALQEIQREFSRYLDTILAAESFVRRINGPGRIDAGTVLAFGGTGVAARASGVSTDYRRDHPHLAYHALALACHKEQRGDVASRLLVRAREVQTSFGMAAELIERMPGGAVTAPLPRAPARASALGYSESPRGANVHWLMADDEGRVYRLRIRSAAYANWPLVARAVVENVVPDFPLINKSFELCYACCDR